MAIDYELFEQNLINYLKNHQKTDFDLKSKDCGEYGCWGIISTAIHGYYSRLKSLELFAAWKNNNRDIRIKTLNILKSKTIIPRLFFLIF